MAEQKEMFKRAFRPLELILIFAVCVIFVQVLAEVVSRYIFNFSIAWGEELAQTLIVWITFLGAAIALLYSEHMAINILFNVLKGHKITRFFLLLGDVVIVYFLLVAIYGGIKVALLTWQMKTVTMQIPAGILYLAFPVGAVLMLIIAVRNFFLHCTKGDI